MQMEEKQTQPETETDESNWAKDQEKRSYYYDDAHGYEIYKPEEDEEVEEENEDEQI